MHIVCPHAASPGRTPFRRIVVHVDSSNVPLCLAGNVQGCRWLQKSAEFWRFAALLRIVFSPLFRPIVFLSFWSWFSGRLSAEPVLAARPPRTGGATPVGSISDADPGLDRRSSGLPHRHRVATTRKQCQTGIERQSDAVPAQLPRRTAPHPNKPVTGTELLNSIRQLLVRIHPALGMTGVCDGASVHLPWLSATGCDLQVV